jgi:hypothetical protein
MLAFCRNVKLNDVTALGEFVTLVARSAGDVGEPCALKTSTLTGEAYWPIFNEMRVEG